MDVHPREPVTMRPCGCACTYDARTCSHIRACNHRGQIGILHIKKSLTNINKNYLALEEVVGKDVFLDYMRTLFEDTISKEEWNVEKRKPGYSKWMEDKIVDALHNTMPILDKYRKQQDVPMNDKELAAFNNKVANFCNITKNWLKKSQKTKGTWHQNIVTEMML